MSNIQSWNRMSFCRALEERSGQEVVATFDAFHERISAKPYVRWAGSKQRRDHLATLWPFVQQNDVCYFPPVCFRVDEKVEVPFHWMGSPKSPDGERATPFSHEHKRRQLLERLNQLPSVQISAERIRARPTFDLSVLNDEAAANRLSQIFDWYAATVDATEGTFPEEAIAPAVQRMEGATKKITVNRYERSAAARDACIRYHGASCAVCGMEFGEEYGALGEGFIHVHHIEPLSQQEALRRSDPQVDLRPVCPNCHAMIHHGEDAPHSIEKLRRVRANTSTER